MSILRYGFRNGYRRLKRFLAWFPVLWKDEDWDSAYLFEIMRFKISRIRKEIDRNKLHIGYEKDVRDMKVAEDLLARFAGDDFYWTMFQAQQDTEKAGKCTCPDETMSFKSCTDDNGASKGYSEIVFLTCEFCKERHKYWFEREDKKERDDLAFLFGLLRKKSRRWWD